MQDKQSPKYDKHSWGVDYLFLTIFLFFLMFLFLGYRPLFVPDEGRYAEIAREMFVKNNYITPFLNEIKYFEKPPLFYWLGALSFKLFGINLWSIRSVNAIIGIAGCLITYSACRILFDRITGLLAAIILSTSGLYFIMSHMVSLDLPVTVFIATSLFLFLLGQYSPKRRLVFFCFAAFAAGCAVLTKGLIGVLFPILIITSWGMLNKFWFSPSHSIVNALPVTPIIQSKISVNDWLIPLAIFLGVTLPWHVLVQIKNPEFFDFYIIQQHFLRYIQPDIGHYQPIWFFIPCLILGFFPWIIFLPQTLAATIKHFKIQPIESFFLIWAIIIFTFFSFSKSKLIPYILPIFPALAVLVAIYLRKQLLTKRIRLSTKLSCLGLVFFAILIEYVLLHFGQQNKFSDAIKVNLLLNSLTICLIFGAIFSFLLCFKSLSKTLIAITLTVSIFFIGIIYTAAFVDNRSILPLAGTINKLATHGEEVITFNRYYQDLPFYIARRVSVLNWRNELTYGAQFQDTTEWLINDEQFWQRFDNNKTIFIVMNLDEYEKFKQQFPSKKIILLKTTPTTVLISNHFRKI